MRDQWDVIIIGAGASGAHAAVPLVKRGLRVLMLDGGSDGWNKFHIASHQDFLSARRSNENQQLIFCGEDFSGIPLGGLSGGQGGGMLSANRSYVTAHTDQELKINSPEVHVVQSLAKGGLSDSWGAVCDFLSPTELDAIGCPQSELLSFYQTIVDEIGVSGPHHNSVSIPGGPLRSDHHAERILARFGARAERFGKLGLHVREPYLAALSHDKGSRRAHAYNDMEFWSDPNRSVYRPRYTIEELETYDNFSYHGNVVVECISETASGVTITARARGGVSSANAQKFHAGRVVCAAGAINTARILLKSFGMFDQSVPLQTKAHWYVPMLHLPFLGDAGHERRHGLCQLVMSDAADDALTDVYCQMYSYRSLMLFRLMSQLPLPAPAALSLLADWTTSLMIADIRLSHWDESASALMLTHQNNQDVVRVMTSNSKHDYAREKDQLRRVWKGLQAAGVIPLKLMQQPEGSSSHYAGTIPVAASHEFPLTASQDGVLHGSERIIIADASTWRGIPAKPVTMTIMANARRIGTKLADTL